MVKKLTLAGLLLVAAALMLTPAPAKAAMWVGAEVGANKMANNDLKLSEDGGSLTLDDYKWRTKVIGGVTIGYHFVNQGFLAYNWPDWMKYFQFAIDFSFHTIETGSRGFLFPEQELGLSLSRIKGDVFTVAFLFMGCYGFYPDSVAPFGRVVPYVGVGPALVVSWIQGSGLAYAGPNAGGPFNFNKSSTDIALCAEAGVRFMALKNVSLDVAARYRWLQPNYTIIESGDTKVDLGIRDANLISFLFRANYHF